MGHAGAKPRVGGIDLGKKKSSIMNLGIEGRTAIVCASSQGLGLACAQALAQEGVSVILNGRDQAKLNSAAAALRTTARGEVIPVVADVTTVQGQERLLAALPSPDILINNNAGPAPGNFADIDRPGVPRDQNTRRAPKIERNTEFGQSCRPLPSNGHRLTATSLRIASASGRSASQ